VICCTPEHLPVIREILNDAILNTTALYEYAPRTDESMREWFAVREQGGIPVIGIEWEPGVLAGFATWGPFRPRATYKYSAEHSVYVAEQFRGEGVGRQLMQAIIGEAKNKDLHMLIAGIDATWPISCRRRGSTGIAITGCSPRITSSGPPSRRMTKGNVGKPRDAATGGRAFGGHAARGDATADRCDSCDKPPSHDTSRRQRPNSWPAWARSFLLRARGVVATSDSSRSSPIRG
jgi:phosphinothricin acetyltransferase